MSDLQTINGIGPALEAKLIEAGINSIAELPDDIDKLKELGLKTKALEGLAEYKASQAPADTGGNDGTGDQVTTDPQAPVDGDSGGDGSAGESDAAASSGGQDSPVVSEGDQGNDPGSDSAEKQETESNSESKTDEPNTTDPAVTSGADAEKPAVQDVVEEPEPPKELEAPDVEFITFEITSGAHKGQSIRWTPGAPSLLFTHGLYVSLTQVQLYEMGEEFQKDDGHVRFKYVYANTTSGASLPEEHYRYFAQEVAKKVNRQPHRHQRLV